MTTMFRNDSPAELRSHFSRNLNELLKQAPSVASVCRDIAINRTQFNRYLAGESFPPPDVLTRICDRFQVSSRIINEPLDDIRRSSLFDMRSKVDISPVLGKLWTEGRNRLPDGLYGYYLGDIRSPDHIMRHIARVYTLSNGMRMFKTAISKTFAKSSGQSTRWRDRTYPGIFFGHGDSFSLVSSSSYAPLNFYAVYETGFRGLPFFYPGTLIVSQQARSGQRQVVPTLLEHLRGGMEEYRYHRKRVGQCTIESLDPIQKEFFETWQPCA